MAAKTYRATKDQSIDGYKFKAGDTIGTGSIGENIGEGEFTPDEQCPRVALGHVQARLYRGLVTDAEPDEKPAPETEPAPEPAAPEPTTESDPAEPDEKPAPRGRRAKKTTPRSGK